MNLFFIGEETSKKEIKLEELDKILFEIETLIVRKDDTEKIMNYILLLIRHVWSLIGIWNIQHRADYREE